MTRKLAFALTLAALLAAGTAAEAQITLNGLAFNAMTTNGVMMNAMTTNGTKATAVHSGGLRALALRLPAR